MPRRNYKRLRCQKGVLEYVKSQFVLMEQYGLWLFHIRWCWICCCCCLHLCFLLLQVSAVFHCPAEDYAWGMFFILICFICRLWKSHLLIVVESKYHISFVLLCFIMVFADSFTLHQSISIQSKNNHLISSIKLFLRTIQGKPPLNPSFQFNTEHMIPLFKNNLPNLDILKSSNRIKQFNNWVHKFFSKN